MIYAKLFMINILALKNIKFQLKKNKKNCYLQQNVIFCNFLTYESC